jgi:SAM-dependent methyltransferase
MHISTFIDQRSNDTMSESEVREAVRSRYAGLAKHLAVIPAGVTTEGAGCCQADGPDCGCSGSYSTEELREIGLNESVSLGCGNPTMLAQLAPGQVVLDLGSGAGLDVLLSARRVAPDGHAYGVDMTDEMLELAKRNALKAGVANATFLKGTIENVPLPDASVDVVISNCVINLSTDKPAVLTEIARVLKPGGRIGITDIVADDSLTPDQRAERGSYVGCIAGALSFSEFEDGLRGAGLEEVSVTPTHDVADGMVSAIVKATKSRDPARSTARQLTSLSASGGCGCGDGCC